MRRKPPRREHRRRDPVGNERHSPRSRAALGGALNRREIIRPVDQYTEEAEAFALAVLGEKPLPYGVEDAIQTMKIIDAIFESEKSCGWAKV